MGVPGRLLPQPFFGKTCLDQGRLTAALWNRRRGVKRRQRRLSETTLRKALTSALSCCTLLLSITAETEGWRVPTGWMGRVPTVGVVCLIVVLTGRRVAT